MARELNDHSVTENNETALQFASLNGHVAAVECLIMRGGASISVAIVNSETALQLDGGTRDWGRDRGPALEAVLPLTSSHRVYYCSSSAGCCRSSLARGKGICRLCWLSLPSSKPSKRSRYHHIYF